MFEGERENLSFDSNYIREFLDNIYLVNHLHFCGGEVSLYINIMQEVLEIFKEKSVPINYIRVNSNILNRSEKFANFMNCIGKYSMHPENVKLIISKDKFHFDCMQEMGIDSHLYEKNKQWYRERFGENIIFSENSGSQWRVILEGNAKNLAMDKLKGVYVRQFNLNNFKVKPIFVKDIVDKKHKIKNALEVIMLSAEGYIFTNGDFSYETQRNNNHELSLGHIYEDSLKNLIKKWNRFCNYDKNNELYLIENKQLGIYGFISDSFKIQDLIKKAVYSGDEEELIKQKNEAKKLFEKYKMELDSYIESQKQYKENIENKIIFNACIIIQNTIQLADILLNIPNGFWRKIGMKLYESQKNNQVYKKSKG